MKVEVFAKRLEDYARLLERKDDIIFPAANKVFGQLLTRVFVDGEDKNNQLFGLYSTKAMYVKSPYPQVSNGNLKRVGKTGKETKKTAYLGGGYAEFRRKTGRQSNHVDLNLTGSMFLNVGVGRVGGKYAIGFKSKHYGERAAYFEKKYNRTIFQLSKKEETTYRAEIIKGVRKIQKQLGI